MNIHRVAFSKDLTVWMYLVAVALVLATSLGAPLAQPAEAAFPGENGKIAFARSGDIYLSNADGTTTWRAGTSFGPGARPTTATPKTRSLSRRPTTLAPFSSAVPAATCRT